MRQQVVVIISDRNPGSGKMADIRLADATSSDMETVRQLFMEYQQWLGVDLCFQGFQSELATLPGRYAAPDGFILLGLEGSRAVACVAARPFEEGIAELKRLYVNPEYRGSGIGRRLFDQAMQRIQEIGYGAVVLDTLPMMRTAQAMYRRAGFRNIDAYTENPLEGVEYFRLDFSKE